MGSAGQNAGLTAGAPAFCIAPDYPKRGAQRRGEHFPHRFERILRAKYSWIGWECGEGERTVLRQIDNAEDDGAGLRADFACLRRLSAHLSILTSDCEKNLGKD